MISWIKELKVYEKDKTHCLITRRDFERINTYNSIGQPTNPSVGRVFKTVGGLVVEVETDPEPGYVLRIGRLPLFID